MVLIKRVYFLLRLYFLKTFVFNKKNKVHNTKKTLQTLIDKNYSMCRFGDGEFNLIFGIDIPFQKSSDLLSRKLMAVLRNENSRNGCLIGVPVAMFNLKGFNRKSCLFWIDYSKNNKKQIISLMNNEIHYYDSQITRIYVNRSSKRQIKLFFMYWTSLFSGKDLLIVEGKETRFGVGNKLLSEASRIRRIECPNKNAFDKYDVIKNEILKHKCDIVLVALGPTATLLAYDLSNKMRIIDIGNLDIEYEWYLRKKKEKIEGKYSIEVPNGTEVSNVNDEKYKSEIIKEIY